MRPSIAVIKARLLGNIRAALSLVAQVRRTVWGAFSDAVAAQIFLLYAYADNLFAESHPLDATGNRLDQWGEVLTLSRSPASFARLQATIQGVAGARVEQGAELKFEDKFYEVEETVTLTGTSASINIRSRLIGTDQNLADGAELNFTTAISGIQNRVTVTDTLVSATDAETDAAYRERIVQYFQRSTWNAGGIDDYIAWALQNQNVRNAWVAKRLSGVANQVGIFVLKENDALLTAEEIQEVQEYINARAPVTARPAVLSPTIQEVPFVINMRENSLAAQASVMRNLNDLFARSRAPRGTENSDGTINTGQVYISQIREAVSQAVGEVDNVIESPTANIIPTDLYGILNVGEITFGDLES